MRFSFIPENDAMISEPILPMHRITIEGRKKERKKTTHIWSIILIRVVYLPSWGREDMFRSLIPTSFNHFTCMWLLSRRSSASNWDPRSYTWEEERKSKYEPHLSLSTHHASIWHRRGHRMKTRDLIFLELCSLWSRRMYNAVLESAVSEADTD